jgi:hypothetical protein
MPTTVQSIHHIPANAIRSQLQTDGTVLVYLPGDTLPPPPPPGPPPVQQSITKRQLYRGLREKGWFGTTKAQIEAAVDALLAQMPEPPRETARIEFYTSRDYLRTNAMLVAALKAPPLSLTDAGIDDFWGFCATFAPDGE